MAFLIDQLNNSGLFAQSAYSAGIATCDSDGNVITDTYLTAHQPISANEWNDVYNTVNSNSGLWSAGDTEVNTTVQNNSATWNTVTDKLDTTAYTPFDPTYMSGAIDNKLDTTAFSDVSGTFLTAHQSLDGYATTAWVDSQGYLTAHQPISADEWNNVYDTVNVYSGSWTGSETSPTANVDSHGSIDIVSSNNTVYFDVDGDWFSGAVNSAVDVPTGVMVESACEYNAVNEISGYNGSAIAQYGAEKQWLQHDDTIVHVANSAQYAFGVNVSALQQLMGIDETLLWRGTITAVNNPITLTEPYTAFNKIKFTFDLDNTKVDVIQPVIKYGEVTTQFGNNYGAVRSGGAWWECWNIVKFSADNSCTITATKALLWGVNTTATAPSNVYNDWTWTVRNLCEIRGIGRKA